MKSMRLARSFGLATYCLAAMVGCGLIGGVHDYTVGGSASSSTTATGGGGTGGQTATAGSGGAAGGAQGGQGGQGGCASCEQLGLTCGQGPCGNCDNSTKDGNETDTDCGGEVATCATRCANGKSCMVNADCLSGVCGKASVCNAPICGDAVVSDKEDCDDIQGTPESWDGCSADCYDEAPHLLISEFADEEDAEEFVEIYNPANQTKSLKQVYLGSYANYFKIAANTPPPGGDFVVRFPADATIGPHGFVVVSLESSAAFQTEHSGAMPDYDFDPNSVTNTMLSWDGNPLDPALKLDNSKGMLVLFSWDGSSDLVDDLDYVLWGDGDTSMAMDKSGQTVKQSTYKPETVAASQLPKKSGGKNKSLYRCDTAELTESKTGGNGYMDLHDETSENFGKVFIETKDPTPGAPPADLGPCP